MPDTQIAESILALVTSRDRATSTVGDLLEQSAARGNAWFWSSIFRTVGSLLWRGFADNAGRMTGLAFVGLAMDAAVTGLLAFLSGIVFFVAAYASGQHAVSSGWTPVYLIVPTLLASFWVGRFLSRWAAGNELSAAIAYVVLVPIASLLVGLFFVKLTPPELAGVFIADLAQRLPALLGAATARRKKQRELENLPSFG